MPSPEPAKPPTLEEVYEALRDRASTVTRLLQDYGYNETGREDGTSDFGPSAYLVFSNRAAAREVRLGLAWLEGVPVVNVSISRDPYRSVDDYLSVSRFAKKHLAGFDQQTLSVNPEEAAEDEIGRVFGTYAELLRGPALPILRGEAWEEGHYVDWTL